MPVGQLETTVYFWLITVSRSSLLASCVSAASDICKVIGIFNSDCILLVDIL